MGSLSKLLSGHERAVAAQRRLQSKQAGLKLKQAPGNLSRRPLGIETLEARQLMAADLPEAFARFESIDEVKQFVLDRSLAQYADTFGQQVSYWRDAFYPLALPVLEFQADWRGSDSSSALASSASYSTTNVQVEGVDEADIVETDGEHLFMVRGQRLTIADVNPSSDMQVLTDLGLEGNGVGAFLAGNRLAVISTQYFSYPADPLAGRRPFDLLPFSHSFSLQSSVVVTVFDVTDPSSPKEVEQTKIEGSYVSSRAIEDKVFVTIRSSDLLLPPPQLIPDEPPPADESPADESTRLLKPAVYDGDDGLLPNVTYAYFESRDEYLARISPALDAIVAGLLPEYSAWNGDDEFVRGGLLHEPGDIVKPLSDATSQLTSIVAFDVFDDQSGPVAAEAIPTGWATTQYASQDHLYIFESDWGRSGQGESTKVLRFDWDVASGEIRASAFGTFQGSLLNQFSADEYEGRLRVATTQWSWDAANFTSQSRNLVQVLDPVGSQLTVIGQTELVAPGESIQSVRFDGDTGYVVTFRRIDPLFTLDLSDPTNPAVLGELKIPGFSGYLQVLDEDFVLGIGRAPGDGWSTHLQVSLFDVSDLSNPTRVAEYTFSDEIWNSQAEWDSHALTWMPELGLLALPVTGYRRATAAETTSESSSESSSALASLIYRPMNDYYSGMALLRVDLSADSEPETALALAGIVEQDGANRSVRIGSTIYSLSNQDVAAIDSADPTRASSILTLPSYALYERPDFDWPQPIWIDFTATSSLSDEPFAAGLGDSNTVISPSPWDDSFAADAARAALDELASRLSLSIDQLRLITIEATAEGFNVVLGDGEGRFALRVTRDGQDLVVELWDDQFEFPSDGLQKEWHNSLEPSDIDGDHLVSPLDALIVVNQLNAKGAMPLRTERPLRAIQFESRPEFAAPAPFRMRYDSSGDDLLSPIDVLIVINRLNAPVGGEGEAPTASRMEFDAEPNDRSFIVVAPASDAATTRIKDLGTSDALASAPSSSIDAFRDAALQEWLGGEETEPSWSTLAADSPVVAEENSDDIFAEWSSR